MSEQKDLPKGGTQEDRIKELSEENRLLFEQLHVVQEELEKYYHKLKACEQRKDGVDCSGQISASTGQGASPQAVDLLVENQKLRILVEQQKIALQVEGQNSLAARLGSMFIAGVRTTGGLLTLPGKLGKMRKALNRTVPPAELGGKSFQKVIDAYTAGGLAAVEKILDAVFISPAMRANAYTALARHVMLTDIHSAASIARLAWECDPKPYRLKWLAFRLYDAGDAMTAEALLDMLPSDITMSDSEERQVTRVHHDAKQASSLIARKQANMMFVDAKKAEELTKQLVECNKQNTLFAKKVADLEKTVSSYKNNAEQNAKKIVELQKNTEQAQARQAEADALAVQTARMLKNLLTQFESDNAVLSKVTRVVLGAKVSG